MSTVKTCKENRIAGGMAPLGDGTPAQQEGPTLLVDFPLFTDHPCAASAAGSADEGSFPANIGLEDQMSEAGGIFGARGSGWVAAWGRALGAIVLAGFGDYSTYCWTVAAIPTGRQGWFYAIGATTAIFLIWSIAQLAIFRHAPKPDDKLRRRFYGIRFGLIVAIEVAAIHIWQSGMPTLCKNRKGWATQSALRLGSGCFRAPIICASV